jgi:outer membrane lipopolysaccharide assembly protein LptE/RlpB
MRKPQQRMKQCLSMRAASFLVLLSAILLPSCGYHAAGHNSRLPTDLQTIAIPAFVSKTQTFRVEQFLTEAVVEEMTTRTRYRIVNDASEDADAILHGTVTQTETSPLTYDSQTGRASSAIIVVHVKVDLKDRQGKTLFSNPDYIFRDQYQVSRELSSFFAEDTPALRRLTRDFARTLVADILESY